MASGDPRERSLLKGDHRGHQKLATCKNVVLAFSLKVAIRLRDASPILLSKGSIHETSICTASKKWIVLNTQTSNKMWNAVLHATSGNRDLSEGLQVYGVANTTGN